MSLVHLTTALPPVICGVGDYSLILAKGLRERGLDGRFVVGGLRSEGIPERVDGFAVEVLRERTAESLLRALELGGERTVLLQFSGYGYADRGLCFWLVEGLRRWKARDARRRLVTMFHELYAFGPPWRTSFWTAWPQRRIAQGLVALSDRIVCGYELIGRTIRAWTDRPVTVMPVFSNVGELEEPIPLSERSPRAVVFGGPGLRRKVWARIERAVPWLERLGIEEIVDIGPSVSVPNVVAGRPVRAAGVQSTPRVHDLLSAARLGIISYPDHVLAKSGTLSASLAHQLLAVNVEDPGPVHDDIVYGRHLVRCGGPIDADVETTALCGRRWYGRHDVGAHVRLFAASVKSFGQVEPADEATKAPAAEDGCGCEPFLVSYAGRVRRPGGEAC